MTLFNTFTKLEAKIQFLIENKNQSIIDPSHFTKKNFNHWIEVSLYC